MTSSNFGDQCSNMTIEDKRKLIYELSKQPNGALETLQLWSRQEILQIWYSEIGTVKKSSNLTKQKIIENLLKIVSKKNSEDNGIKSYEQEESKMVLNGSTDLKTQKKSDHSCGQSLGNVATLYCKNSACKAGLSPGDLFCKRCSCCICHTFDDNKDPSLWLTCASEPPFEGKTCNMSCHLECALYHPKSGLSRDGLGSDLDASYYCVSCGKINDLLSCWRKQLLIAKDTRRVDILCFRVSMCQRLVSRSMKYKKISDIVDEAVNKLQAEVGPLSGIPMRMGRGIVNRMSCGQEVQRLCSSAVELIDNVHAEMRTCQLDQPLNQDCKTLTTNAIRFEDIRDTCATVILGPTNNPTPESNVGYTLWHRRADEHDFGNSEPTCTLSTPETKYFVSGLAPSTEYIFKVVSFDSSKELCTCEARLMTSKSHEDIPRQTLERSQSPVTNCSTLSNPSSVEDETNNHTSGSTENIRVDNRLKFKGKAENTGPTDTAREPRKQVGAGQDWNPIRTIDGWSSGQSNPVKIENNHLPEGHGKAPRVGNRSKAPAKTGKATVPLAHQELGLPATPCRSDILETVCRKGGPKSGKKMVRSRNEGEEEQLHHMHSSKKRRVENRDRECRADDSGSEEDLERHVKVMRKLECEGHIEKSFRKKFLTWYSLRATPREMKVVQVFVDTLMEDPAMLAEQLIDAFEDIVSNKRTNVVPSGFCMKLWH